MNGHPPGFRKTPGSMKNSKRRAAAKLKLRYTEAQAKALRKQKLAAIEAANRNREAAGLPPIPFRTKTATARIEPPHPRLSPHRLRFHTHKTWVRGNPRPLEDIKIP